MSRLARAGREVEELVWVQLQRLVFVENENILGEGVFARAVPIQLVPKPMLHRPQFRQALLTPARHRGSRSVLGCARLTPRGLSSPDPN